MNKKWKSYLIVTLLFFIVVAIIRLVPIGASPLTFLLASVKGKIIYDSSGNEYTVYYNDAGGMHSGNHWTWLVKDYLIFRKISYSGYVSSDIYYDVGLSIGHDGHDDFIDFLDRRYGSNVVRMHIP